MEKVKHILFYTCNCNPHPILNKDVIDSTTFSFSFTDLISDSKNLTMLFYPNIY